MQTRHPFTTFPWSTSDDQRAEPEATDTYLGSLSVLPVYAVLQHTDSNSSPVLGHRVDKAHVRKSLSSLLVTIRCGTTPGTQVCVCRVAPLSTSIVISHVRIKDMATLPPPTQDSNLRGMAVSSISLVTFAIGANLVFLRMYVRMKRHITGWDDYTICLALVYAFAHYLAIKCPLLLTRTGTCSPRNGGRRLSSCQWRWQAHRNFELRTAVRIHQVDLC